MTTDVPEAIALARQELQAAFSILLDPASHARTAQTHLVSAWRLLHERAAAAGDVPDELSTWILAHAEPLSDGDRARAASLVSSLVVDESRPPASRGRAVGTRELLRNARDLGKVLDAIEASDGHRSAWSSGWLWRGLKVGAVLALFAWFLVTIRGKEDLGRGRWRGDYYPTHTFEGEPTLRRDQDINFSWGSNPPHERISSDKFSIRWDTCLDVPESTLIRFDLRSDDGSRLFVDGDRLIDLWDGRGTRSGDATITLSPGVHHLRVDYFEARGSASVKLRASVNGEKPGPVPKSILRYPGDQIDPDNPCGRAGS